MANKILFICKKRTDFYGPYGAYDRSYGLINSAQFVCNFLTSQGFENKVVTVDDGNGIDKEVFAYKPTHVIIEAIWATPDKMKELMSLRRYRDIIWIIRLHSKIPFLAYEGTAISWLYGYKTLQATFENLLITVNNKEMVKDLSALFRYIIYLPNIYQPNSSIGSRSTSTTGVLNIGCFGSIRPLKNQLKQAIAAIDYGNATGIKINFHINSDRIEQSGNNVYKNIKALFNNNPEHSLVEHPWLNHADFINLVLTMDLGLQVSLSETFNIVAADFAWNHVPIIGSREIEWLVPLFKANPNSLSDIEEKMNLILNTVGLYKLNRTALVWHNNRAGNTWKMFLS